MIGEITNVEGGKVDVVEAEETTSEDGVITQVEPRVASGRVGSIRSSAKSSLSSSSGKESPKTKKSLAYKRNLGS